MFAQEVHDNSGSLTLSARTQVDYDGMIRTDWRLIPGRRLRLDSLTLELPLHAGHGKYLYYYRRSDKWKWPEHKIGRLPKKGKALPFDPMVWLGDEERGVEWFTESDKNWYNAEPDRAIEVVPEGDEVWLRIHLVSRPLQMSPDGATTDAARQLAPTDLFGDLTYTFGLHATPVKPVHKDAWDYRISNVGQGTFGGKTRLNIKESDLDRMAQAGVRTLLFFEHWTDIEGYTATAYKDDLHRLVKNCHDRGMQIILYFGFLISDLAPEWPYFGEECVRLPKGGYIPYEYPPQPRQNAYVVCYQSAWQDSLVAGIARMMDEYDIDGVYLDGTAMFFGGCENSRHGCGYVRSDGTVARTYPHFAVRDTLKRIYTVVKTRKPEGQVFLHHSCCLNIPAVGWATVYWDGEHLWHYFADVDTPKPMFILDGMPLDMFRTEFMGHQWGVPSMFLYYHVEKFTGCNKARVHAIALLHGVFYMEAGDVLDLSPELWRISDEFGRKEAEWFPYWRNSGYVRAGPEGAYVSFYRHPRNGVLAVVSNLQRKAQTIRVKLNLARLGLAPRLTARDALSGDRVKIEGDSMELALPSLGWKLIWVRGAADRERKE